MTKSKFAAFLASIALALATPALAHGPGGGGACSGMKGQMETLCAGATPGTCLSTLCPDVPPGPGQWPQCLLNLNGGTETLSSRVQCKDLREERRDPETYRSMGRGLSAAY
jgi:hypothetical protein